MRTEPAIDLFSKNYERGEAQVVWTTLVGYMPITALAVYFGTRLEGMRFTDPIVIGSVVALLVLLLIGNWIVRRQAAAAS